MSIRNVLNIANGIADLNSKNVSVSIQKSYYPTSSYTWSAWADNDNSRDYVQTQTAQTQIRIRLTSSGDDVYDLSPLSDFDFTNAVYRLKSGTPTNYQYSTLKTWAESGTVYTPNANQRVTVVEDNVKVADNIYETILRTNAYVSDSFVYLVLPEIWYAIVASAESRTLTQNLTNCTSDTTDTEISTDATTIVLTADTDCSFDNGITVTGANYVVNYNSNYTVATISLEAGSDGDTITITANATLHVTYTFTSSITNGTCSLVDGSYAENSTLIATITPDSNYWFRSVPICNDSSAVITFDSDTGVYTVTFTITQNTTITASATWYTYLNLTHVISAGCNYNDTDKIFVGETYHIEVNALSGYYFGVTPNISYRDYYGIQTEYDFTASDVSEYHSRYYYDLSLTMPITGVITIYASAIVIPITDKLGIITIYLPTTQNLKDLANVRFIQGTGTNIETVDLGQYITGLLRVFIDVPSYGNQEINLGGNATGITSAITLENIITTDCGTVDIDQYFNNVMDYNNTTISLYLPLYGMVELDTSLVMRKTVHIEYLTNILNGDVLINIYSDDILIAEYATTGYYEIPYILNRDNKPIGGINFNGNYMGDFTPFITISRDTPYNTASIEAPKDEHVLLSSLSGFNKVEIEDINIPNSLKEEREMIQNILRAGVIY